MQPSPHQGSRPQGERAAGPKGESPQALCLRQQALPQKPQWTGRHGFGKGLQTEPKHPNPPLTLGTCVTCDNTIISVHKLLLSFLILKAQTITLTLNSKFPRAITAAVGTACLWLREYTGKLLVFNPTSSAQHRHLLTTPPSPQDCGENQKTIASLWVEIKTYY